MAPGLRSESRSRPDAEATDIEVDRLRAVEHRSAAADRGDVPREPRVAPSRQSQPAAAPPAACLFFT
eukprot:1666391-Heterocapsa_arctica.AAC.1